MIIAFYETRVQSSSIVVRNVSRNERIRMCLFTKTTAKSNQTKSVTATAEQEVEAAVISIVATTSKRMTKTLHC